MKRFTKFVTFWMIYCVALIFLGLSCTEEQLRWIDKTAGDVNTIAEGTQSGLDSPAGQLIPPDLRLYGALGVIILSGLANGWQDWRNRTMKKTTKAIVKGIEKSDNPDETSIVKKNIADEMTKQGGDKFYKRANKIVDRLKIA